MNLNLFKQRLLVKEREVSARIERAAAEARDQPAENAHDAGDDSAADELREERFAEAGADRTLLQEVRDALRRIEGGTFGACAVDGEPIEEERLIAVPWTQYCLKHQGLRELAGATHTPTL